MLESTRMDWGRIVRIRIEERLYSLGLDSAFIILHYTGCFLLERRTHGRKVASSNPDWSSGSIFFSRVGFVCWLLFDVRSVLPRWHVTDPSHSAKGADGRLHLNTHTTLTERSRSWLTMPLSGHSVGTYLETSSHATCLGTFSHSRLSSPSHCGLILVKEWI